MKEDQNVVRKAPKVGEVWTNRACNNFVVVAKTGSHYITTPFYQYQKKNLSECSEMTIGEFMGIEWNGAGYAFKYRKVADTFEEAYPMKEVEETHD